MCVRGRRYPPYADFGEVLTDHWVKGPHHFWIDVATNLMIREWQPFNGHQVYYNWKVGPPSKEDVELPDICVNEGPRFQNLSCFSPGPTAELD